MTTYVAFFGFLFAGYLGWIALARSGDWDGATDAKWSGRGALVFLLVALGALCVGAVR